MPIIRDTIIGIILGSVAILAIGAYVFREQFKRLIRYLKDWLDQDSREEREQALYREERLRAARELNEELIESKDHLEQNL